MTVSPRVLGSRATFAAAFEVDYGVPPDASAFLRIPMSSEPLSEEQKLITDDSLGAGREQIDSILDEVTNSGDATVAVDDTYFGLWLKGAFGDPTSVGTVAATGSIAFSANPPANKTITLNGVAWTFVAAAPAGSQVQIGATLADTLTALATALNASGNAALTGATYTAAAGALNVAYKTLGGGNDYTLAAATGSNATVSGASLTGGLTKHTFLSGSYDLPSLSVEIGSPELPNYGVNTGTMVNTIKIAMSRSGLLNATISLMAQGETLNTEPVNDALEAPSYARFTNPTGFINIDGEALGNVNTNSFTYDNGLAEVDVIRPDGRIGGADPGKTTVSYDLSTYWDSMDLVNRAVNHVATGVSFGWTIPGTGKSLIFTTPRTFFPKPKRAITNDKQVMLPSSIQAVRDPTLGATLMVELVTHVPTY